MIPEHHQGLLSKGPVKRRFFPEKIKQQARLKFLKVQALIFLKQRHQRINRIDRNELILHACTNTILKAAEAIKALAVLKSGGCSCWAAIAAELAGERAAKQVFGPDARAKNKVPAVFSDQGKSDRHKKGGALHHRAFFEKAMLVNMAGIRIGNKSSKIGVAAYHQVVLKIIPHPLKGRADLQAHVRAPERPKPELKGRNKGTKLKIVAGAHQSGICAGKLAGRNTYLPPAGKGSKHQQNKEQAQRAHRSFKDTHF